MSTTMIEASKAQDKAWAAVETWMRLLGDTGATDAEIEMNLRALMAQRKASVARLCNEANAALKAWYEADEAAVAAFNDPKVSQLPARREMARAMVNRAIEAARRIQSAG